MIYTYKHSNDFESFDTPELQKYNGNIIVWGAGRIGGVAAHVLKKKGIKLIGFCDSAKDKWETEFCGYKVMSPEKLKTEYPEALVLISTVFHVTIYDQLKEWGFENVYDCAFLFMEIDFSDYDFWMDPPYAIRNVEQYLAAVLEQKKKEGTIDQIFLNITTACTLKCRDCSMFIPYVKKPCIYPSDEIMKDFMRVLSVLGHIRIVNFYGGEPLLHPDLAKMIQSLKADKRIDRISFITNGTIVPNSELIEVLKNEPRIMVRISDYGKISTKLDELTAILDDNGIAYEIANYTYWDAPSTIGVCNESEAQLRRKFIMCTSCNVLFILNRKAYLCSTGSAVGNMDVFPPSKTNCIQIEEYDGRDEDLFAKDLKEFIGRPKKGMYLDACKYCSGGHCVQFENKLPVAVQTDKTMVFGKLY